MQAIDVPAAGVAFRAGAENAKECFSFPEPPLTPHNVKKYRKSMTEEPGKRIVHYGIIDDQMKFGAERAERRYGTNTYLRFVTRINICFGCLRATTSVCGARDAGCVWMECLATAKTYHY